MKKTTWSEPRWDWHKRSAESIAQNSLTNSKRRSCLVEGIYPTHLSSASGCYVTDTDNRRYIDYICGLGTNILGYGNEQVHRAAFLAYQRYGGTPSLATETEVLAAEKIKEMCPWVERVKFFKTGSEACSAAIRIARAHTGKNKITSFGYHGWHDSFTSLTPPAVGVPEDENIWSGGLDWSQTAGVILEPVELNMNLGDTLIDLKQHCGEGNIVLIYDEVITGLRVPKLTVSRMSNVEPDLIVLGKAIGNGFPIAAVAGKKDIMESTEYFVSGTFNGEPMSLAAMIQTIDMVKERGVEHLWEKGDEFLNKFNELHPTVKIKGYPTRGRFEGPTIDKTIFWQEACKAGLLFGPSWFYNFEHIKLNDQVLSICDDIFTKMKAGKCKLEGKPPMSPFAERARNGNG